MNLNLAVSFDLPTEPHVVSLPVCYCLVEVKLAICPVRHTVSVTGQTHRPRPKTLTLLWEKDVGSKTTVTRQRKRTLRTLSTDVCLSVCAGGKCPMCPMCPMCC